MSACAICNGTLRAPTPAEGPVRIPDPQAPGRTDDVCWSCFQEHLAATAATVRQVRQRLRDRRSGETPYRFIAPGHGKALDKPISAGHTDKRTGTPPTRGKP